MNAGEEMADLDTVTTITDPANPRFYGGITIEA